MVDLYFALFRKVVNLDAFNSILHGDWRGAPCKRNSSALPGLRPFPSGTDYSRSSQLSLLGLHRPLPLISRLLDNDNPWALNETRGVGASGFRAKPGKPGSNRLLRDGGQYDTYSTYLELRKHRAILHRPDWGSLPRLLSDSI